MTAATQARLKEALEARLGEAAASALEGVPPEARLKSLAHALGVDEDAALSFLSEITGLSVLPEPAVDIQGTRIFPARLATRALAIPVALASSESGRLDLATPWPPAGEMQAWAATFCTRRPRWFLAPADRVGQLVRESYGVGSGSLGDDEADEGLVAAPLVTDTDADADAAVVRFVTDVLTQAVAERATDIHFEPQEGKLAIRFRIDGILVPVPLPENLVRYQDAILSRLKIMARLNISERRLPQDGRITFRDGINSIDIRVSTMPTLHAESISLRLLNQRKEAYDMSRVGMGPEEQAAVRRVLAYPHGIILVTGPTGSGKSTTLNAFLREINSPELRLVTIEDPVEYEVPGANQVQIKPEIGLTFASTLRSTLRQDPDVIMVGEIRDLETAEISIRASLTGHLVFSTLHTNDAPGAITRLIDKGVEPFLVASAVELVIAQRLLRRVCPDCTVRAPVERPAALAALKALGLPATVLDGVQDLPKAVGCRRCRGTGYAGRVGIFELYFPKPAHDKIVSRVSSRDLTEAALAEGMRPLARTGWEKVLAGYTTLDELVRNVASSE